MWGKWFIFKLCRRCIQIWTYILYAILFSDISNTSTLESNYKKKNNILLQTFEPYVERLTFCLNSKKTTKLCYTILVEKYTTSLLDTNQKEKWQLDLEENLDNSQTWEARFHLIYNSSIYNKLKKFQFKFIYRKISTNEFLFKIGVKSSPLRSFCDSCSQLLTHLFLKCEYVMSFWKRINKWLCKKKNMK